MVVADGSLPLGEVIYSAVKPIFKIYLIIGVGFFLSRKNILTVDTSRNISTIAIRVLIPCLTFQKIVSNINNTMIKEIATIVIVAYFMMFSQALAVFGVGVLVGCPKNWYGGLILCGLLPNISDLPIAYLQTMETSNIFENVDLGVSFVMIYMSLQLLLQFTFGSYKLIEYDFKVDLKMQLEKSIENGDGDRDLNNDLENNLENHSSFDVSSSSSNTHREKNSNDDDDNNNNDTIHPKISISHNNNSIDLHSIDLHSIDSHSIESSSNHIMHLPNVINQTSNILKTLTNNSMSRQNSRVSISVPNNLTMNDQMGQHPEDINDIVRVYSKYDKLIEEQDLSKLLKDDQIEKNLSPLAKFKYQLSSINWNSVFWGFVDVWKDSFKQPASIVVVLSIAISMIPWVQALFINSNQVHLSPAPDKQPPLSFIMDFASYIGAAQVPFGLLLLGGTIGRLRIDSLPKKLWKIPIVITLLKIFIFPIIGCALNAKIYRDGLFYHQDILYFVSNIEFCVPPATSLLYITAFYTPNDGKNHIQMDLLALVYIFHYIFLVICLPFTATYTMKVALGY